MKFLCVGIWGLLAAVARPALGDEQPTETAGVSVGWFYASLGLSGQAPLVTGNPRLQTPERSVEDRGFGGGLQTSYRQTTGSLGLELEGQIGWFEKGQVARVGALASYALVHRLRDQVCNLRLSVDGGLGRSHWWAYGDESLAPSRTDAVLGLSFEYGYEYRVRGMRPIGDDGPWSFAMLIGGRWNWATR